MHWRAVSKAGFYGWAALYALLLLQAVLTDWTTPFSSLLDIPNGLFHSIGHALFGALSAPGSNTALLGGTLGQLIPPFVFAVVFLWLRRTAGFAFGWFWLCQNLLSIGVYVADARARRLTLEIETLHDWNNLLNRWQWIDSDARIGNALRAEGWLGMLAAVAWLWWKSSTSQEAAREAPLPMPAAARRPAAPPVRPPAPPPAKAVLAAAKTTVLAPAPTVLGTPARGGAILVVDDEENVREMYGTMLRGKGFVVLLAGNGEEALSVIQQFQKPILAAVVKLRLAGESGRDAVESIKSVCGNLKVIYVLGYGYDEVPLEASVDPTTSFLQRPFTPNTLARKLAEMIAPAPGAAATPTPGKEEPAKLSDRMRECPLCGVCHSGEVLRCPADGADLLDSGLPLAIAGRYRIERRLGAGGMGVVYLAIDPELGRQVAVKLIRPEYLAQQGTGGEGALERFRREARAAGALSHPNIIAVFDFGGLPGGGAFLVMEYLQGESLRDMLMRGERFAPDRALEILEGVAAAVQTAHLAGIVHRDLKPDNVMVVSDPAQRDRRRAKVLDFGLAKSLTGADQLTSAGMIVGTLAYMAPELLAGEPQNMGSDIYALAVMAYEMLTGSRPGPEGPAEGPWQQVFARALARLPSRRYPSAAEFYEDLRRHLAGLEAAPAAQGSASPASSAETRVLPSPGDPSEETKA